MSDFKKLPRYGGTLEQYSRQAINAERMAHKMLEEYVADITARGGKVTFFMDEIIVEWPETKEPT